MIDVRLRRVSLNLCLVLISPYDHWLLLLLMRMEAISFFQIALCACRSHFCRVQQLLMIIHSNLNNIFEK